MKHGWVCCCGCLHAHICILYLTSSVCVLYDFLCVMLTWYWRAFPLWSHWRWRPDPPGTSTPTVPLTPHEVFGIVVRWQNVHRGMCVWVHVCVHAWMCVWMMDWGHGGLQGCNVVAKTNSCACVWGRCFIETQHTEISQINTPLPLSCIFVFVSECVCFFFVCVCAFLL